MTLFAELQRRKVFKVGAAYLVVAWLAVQAASIGFPAFDAPPWALRIFILVSLLGFPVAVVLAWVFESTPAGVTLDRPVRGSKRVFAIAALLAVLAIGWYFYGQPSFRRGDPATPTAPVPAAAASAPDAHSIAVLPFVNMSSDKEQEYFSDGLSEELLNQLAQIPQLRVIARTSSFSFKGKDVDVATIARALNVAHVLEGSVRKSATKLRITAQLIRAADSSHLWSQTYDRDPTDVFKVQDEIAAEVVSALRLTLLSARMPAAPSRTANPEAHDHLLRGLHLAARGTADSYRQAIAEYQRAIELDPGYASAYANLASATAFVADMSADPIGQMRAQQAVEKALALAPGDPEALATRGWMRSLFLWDWDGARADFEVALPARPNDAIALSRYSWLLAATGHLPEAIVSATKANALDPRAEQVAVFLGIYLNATGDHAAARKLAQQRLEISPEDAFANLVVGMSLLLDGKAADAVAAVHSGTPGVRLWIAALAEHALGREDESARALAELERDHASGFAYQVASAHAWRGEKDAAFQWLDRAFAQRDGGMAMIKYDPIIASLRDDPRYAAIVRKLGLPP